MDTIQITLAIAAATFAAAVTFAKSDPGPMAGYSGSPAPLLAAASSPEGRVSFNDGRISAGGAFQ